MKPRDVFKIIVATVGLLGFCYGVLYLIDGVLFTIGLLLLQHSQPGYYVGRGVIEMILGILFMKGIPPFVDLAFPRHDAPSNEEQEAMRVDEEYEGPRCVSCQSPISQDTKLCPKCGYTQPL